MIEPEAEALRKLRQYLVESIAYAADQIKEIDAQLKFIRGVFYGSDKTR